MFGIINTAVQGIVGIGAGAIVGNAIKATTPENVKPFFKLSINVAGFVMGAAAADATTKYIDNSVKEFIGKVNEAKAKLDERYQGTAETAEEK